MVDKLRAEGASEKMAGKAKEVAGKVTGDTKLEVEGKTEKTVGGIKNAIGGAADAVRDADHKTR